MTWLLQNLKIAIGAVLLAAVAIFFILSGESGPEAAINGQLDDLTEMVSFEAPEPQIEQITKAKKFSNFFTEAPYLIAWPGQSAVTNRDALTGLFVSMRRMAKSAKISMSSRQLTLDPSERTASLTTNVKGKVDFQGDSESYSGRYRIQFEKVDGDWLISSAEPLN